MKKDSVVSAGKVLPIQLMYLTLFGAASLQKFFNFQQTVGHFQGLFKDSFIVNLPGGMAPQVAMIAGTEFLIALLCLVSLFRKEFMAGACRVWITLALILSSLLFIQLGMGLRIIGDFQSAANTFFYFGITQILIYFLCQPSNQSS